MQFYLIPINFCIMSGDSVCISSDSLAVCLKAKMSKDTLTWPNQHNPHTSTSFPLPILTLKKCLSTQDSTSLDKHSHQVNHNSSTVIEIFI
jgi:hypothetical protein